MKFFDWSDEKNELLLRERGLSFERVVMAVAEGGLLDIVEHPNPEKYRGQRMMIVRIDDHAVLVPFIEDERSVLLKTVIPSRKATKKYMTRERDED